MAPKKQTDVSGGVGAGDVRLRVAIVSGDRCKPKKCRQECKKFCPVVRTGKQCVVVEPTSKIAFISEPLCIGCGICVKKCPFDAIQIINLPKDLGRDISHRFGVNSFKLHRLPTPRLGQVLGLIGTNGIGKSTALAILSGRVKPNLGNFSDPPDWKTILKFYRGSELQNYFTKVLEGDLRPAVKPQYVDALARKSKKTVQQIVDPTGNGIHGLAEKLAERLQLSHLMERNVSDLSGGELQRFALLVASIQDANVIMFDEPSSYLDIKQRIIAAQVIRSLLKDDNYVIVVEHDLAVSDYLSDTVCCLWGCPSAYGVVTTPFSVKEGINIYLEGFIPTENLRFRDESISFRITQDLEDETKREAWHEYPRLSKQLGSFKLTIEPGAFADSEITVLLGQNGTGKTTFIRILAGLLAADGAEKLPKLIVSYKPQTISAKFDGTVEQLLNSKIRDAYHHPQFITDVIKPMQIEKLKNLQVLTLSGGELQRVALVLALGKPADVYLLDEPSAYLDCEQRIEAARVIKRFILHAKKSAFIVEHDFIMATYLADKVIVYEGAPGVDCTARSPQSLISGMNIFLAMLETTFRRDPINYRPRINKLDSVKDREQKLAGNYFVVDDS
ncbi:RNase L inhibitor ATP-binding cassette domain protein [Gregarina niphandrodes]|uniref:RNase L inhibitor ATP-binding cassette domain protein n=1 Tax=Gregarina niphandrodes TaxID=110365 RepID=A0A023BA86_GRENI|nr:RNase L inhibitor ATP-binding cassette domain protein [Gregarina niphandrodes]EZG77683.1 RNase L inhibitor ATP-binding cassette domain protein [Gregarina niphandrodes]|eukprot:XP_011129482.1 RNase L inhibitor ATP-binding cassette domain protein [Gregarina niphandrodes]